MGATGRFRLGVAVAAVVVTAVGALAWSRLVGGTSAADDQVRLDVPGEYVEPGGPTNPPLPTDQLPDVTLETAAGEPVRLLAGDGRPMVVNLWYSACAPCARELGDLALVDDELAGRVRFVGVNPYDTAETMTRFAADRGVRYELVRDPAFALADELGIVAYPVTLLVDPDGRIVEQTGPLDASDLRALVAEHWS